MGLDQVPQGFETVALANLDAAYNLARWLMRDPSDAEDVVQEAMVRALTYFAGFRGTNPRAWLLQIVRNTAYASMKLNRGAATVALDKEEDNWAERLPDPGDDPERALERVQDKNQVDGLIAQLPVELRECLVMRELEEMSYKEIAHVAGVPIGTVMSRLWRARQLLTKAATRQETVR